MKIIFVMLLAFSTYASAATVSYNCSFPTVASPDGLKETGKPFELKFMSDQITSKSFMVGNNGIEGVQAIQNTGGISFVEITGSGNVQVTAITESGNAVHSRNSILSSGLIPSQYYGTCKRY